MSISSSLLRLPRYPRLSHENPPTDFRRRPPSPSQNPFLRCYPIGQFPFRCKLLPLTLKPPSTSRHFSFDRNLGHSFAANAGEEGDKQTEEDGLEEARRSSTLPSRFRHLTKEAPDRPLIWPWFIGLFFLIYTWRAVAWELTTWKKAIVSISRYLFLFILSIIYHFFGDIITGLIRYIETCLYFAWSIYSNIVAATPVQELTLIIILTSAVMAVAETVVPDSVTSQLQLLTFTGLIGFGVIQGFVPVLLFWFLLLGLFCFSYIVKKRDGVSSTLPVAAVLAAVGEPWVRVLIMALYLALAIVQHSKSPKRKPEIQTPASGQDRVPVPLFVAALTIGIHVAAKWVRYRHLTWMIA